MLLRTTAGMVRMNKKNENRFPQRLEMRLHPGQQPGRQDHRQHIDQLAQDEEIERQVMDELRAADQPQRQQNQSGQEKERVTVMVFAIDDQAAPDIAQAAFQPQHALDGRVDHGFILMEENHRVVRPHRGRVGEDENDKIDQSQQDERAQRVFLCLVHQRKDIIANSNIMS